MRSQLAVAGASAAAAPGGNNERSPLEKNPVQPASLRRHHLYATPVSRRSLMLAGRGKQALQEGQAWQSKVALHPLLLHLQAACGVAWCLYRLREAAVTKMGTACDLVNR